MRQELIKKAQNIITQRRLDAENEYRKAMTPLYNDKEYVSLEKEQTKLMIENARKESLGQKPDTKTAKEIETKINAVKAKHNLQDVEKRYSCPLCKDTGYQNGQMCKCLKQEISLIALKDSGFENLESFDKCTKTSGNEKVYDLMKQWCNKDSTKNLIYIAGPTGVGKTVLIRCMANELISNGKVIRLTTAFKMNQDFKEFQKTRNEDLLNKYLTPEYLFVDDLGTEPKYKDVTLEFLYLIINERKMKNLSTIITSNLDLKDLIDRYEERIASRIIDKKSSITILLEGDDKRLKK